MDKWTSCQYDNSLHLDSVASVEGGTNPRRQAIMRSFEYEHEHRNCVAIEVEGGLENCPIDIEPVSLDQHHQSRGK